MKSSSISYNVDLSKKIGINSAIFISLLDMLINSGDERIILDREFIYDRTGLDFEMQEAIESLLVKNDLIAVRKVRNSDCKNYYGIDYVKLEKLIEDKDFQIDSAPLKKKENLH